MQYILGEYTAGDNLISYLTQRDIFAELDFKGRRLYGGCTESILKGSQYGPWIGTSAGPSWRQFLLGPLQVDTARFKVHSIEFLVAGYFSVNQTDGNLINSPYRNRTFLNPFLMPSWRVVACNESSMATRLVKFMRDPQVVNSTLTITCPAIAYRNNHTFHHKNQSDTYDWQPYAVNHTWVARYCPSDFKGVSYPSICVNCTDPCSLMMYCNSTDQHIFEYHLAPCRQTVTCPMPYEPRIRFLSVVFEDQISAPRIIDYFADTTSTSIAMGLTLSAPGFAYCAAFLPSESTIVTSSLQITLMNHGAYSDANNRLYIKIDGLAAITLYHIYCVTSTLNGVLQPFTTVLKNQTYPLTTVCCRQVSVNLASDVALLNQPSSQFVTVTFQSTGPFPPSVTIYTEYINTTNKIAFQPSFFSRNMSLFIKIADPNRRAPAARVNNIYPPSGQTPIADLSEPTSLFFDLGPSRVGWYLIKVVLIPALFNRTQLDPTYVTTSGLVYETSTTFAVLDPLFRTPAPNIMSATYSNDGTYIDVEFDMETNRGGQMVKFLCNYIFSGKGMDTALCDWYGNSNLRVFITDSAGAVPGDTLRVLRNNMIRPSCTDVQTAHRDCAVWPEVGVGTFVIQNAVVPTVPTVTVSAPAIASPCALYTIDLTSSQGNCGRLFSSICRSRMDTVMA